MSTENKLFAQRFKQLRLSRGCTQQQMANLFNVTRPCICYWESGKRVPDFIKLIEICRFFDVSSDYMLGVSSAPTSDTEQVASRTDDTLDMTRLTESSKEKLREFYDFLIYNQNSDN